MSRRTSSPTFAGVCGDALARPGDGQRPVAGHTARESQAARRVLGHRLRLAEGGGEAEFPASVHDRDRRRRHPLHSRSLETSQCSACYHDAWLAGIGVRAAQDRSVRSRIRPPMAEPPRTRSTSLFPRCRATASPASRRTTGWGRPHRANLGGADEAPRLHQLRRPWRRLGLPRLQRHGAPGADGTARHPHQFAGVVRPRSPRCSPSAGRRRRDSPSRSARRSTRSARPPSGQPVLCRDDGRAAADDRLRHDGLSRRPCGVDARPSGLLALDIRRQRSRESPQTRCWTTSRSTG